LLFLVVVIHRGGDDGRDDLPSTTLHLSRMTTMMTQSLLRPIANRNGCGLDPSIRDCPNLNPSMTDTHRVMCVLVGSFFVI
jgi:hypothetical protein